MDSTLDSHLADASFHRDVDPSTITLRQLLNHTHGITSQGPVTMRLAYSPDQVSTPLGNGTLCLGPATLGFVQRLPGLFASALEALSRRQLQDAVRDAYSVAVHLEQKLAVFAPHRKARIAKSGAQQLDFELTIDA